MNSDLSRLKELTEKLIQKNRLAKQHFEAYTLEKQTADFQTVVLPFANSVKVLMDEWSALALLFVSKEKPKYFHVNQVESAQENIESQAVQCFQSDTRKKRFVERNKSIEYTLETLLKSIQ